jgi:hypothetical protein
MGSRPYGRGGDRKNGETPPDFILDKRQLLHILGKAMSDFGSFY